MRPAAINLARLSYMLAIGVLTIVVLWPWVQGPASLAASSFIGWFGSGVITDRLARRPVAWRTACAQGVVSCLTIWLTLRWLAG